MKKLNNTYLNAQNITDLIGKTVTLDEGRGARPIKIMPVETKSADSNSIGQDEELRLTFHFWEKQPDYYEIDGKQLETLNSKGAKFKLSAQKFRVLSSKILEEKYDRKYKSKGWVKLSNGDCGMNENLREEWQQAPTYAEVVEGESVIKGKWKDEGLKNFIYEWGGYFRVGSSADMLQIISIDGEPVEGEAPHTSEGVIFDTSNGLSAAIADMELAWKNLDIKILPNLEMIRFLEGEAVSLIRFAGNTETGSTYEIESTDGISYFIEIDQMTGEFRKIKSKFSI